MRTIAWSLVLIAMATEAAAEPEPQPEPEPEAEPAARTFEAALAAAVSHPDVSYTFEGSVESIGCYFPMAPTVMERAWPALGVTVEREDLTIGRSGTVADLLAMVPAVAGVPLEERLDGGLRLPGSPALSRVFAEEVVIGLLPHPQVDVAPLSGQNERETTLAATFLHDGDAGGGLAALLRGPIAKDHAWYAVGADLRGDTGQVYGRLDAAATPDHQFRMIALATAPGWPAAAPSASTVAVPRLIGGGGEDGRLGDVWLDARWRSRLDDHRLELEAGATTQTLVVDGERITRHAARAGVVRRLRLRGSHELRAAVEATQHEGDVRVDLIDAWNLTPSVQLDVAVRVEDREAAPRAALTWDPSAEGRSRYFVDLRPGALTAGGQNQIGEKLVLGGAWRRTAEEAAAEDTVHGWALYRPWDPGLGARAAISGPLVKGAPVTAHVEASYRLTVCIGDLVAAAGVAHADDSTRGTFAFGMQVTEFLDGLDVVAAAYTGDDPAFQLSAARTW